MSAEDEGLLLYSSNTPLTRARTPHGHARPGPHTLSGGVQKGKGHKQTQEPLPLKCFRTHREGGAKKSPVQPATTFLPSKCLNSFYYCRAFLELFLC